jgi:hypothetical protein
MDPRSEVDVYVVEGFINIEDSVVLVQRDFSRLLERRHIRLVTGTGFAHTLKLDGI